MSCNSCHTCPISEKRGSGNSTVFNWLYNIESPASENTKLVEVQFKADRKEFYVNESGVIIDKDDWVIVQGDGVGHDLGRVTMKGELVALQIKRKNRDIQKEPLKELYRKASDNDIKKWQEVFSAEQEILVRAKKIIQNYRLEMKLTDVELQADNKKGTFYYTAEKRVDFRELIRDYSRAFGMRIEMKQIGVRQEAAKIGGIGSCGRELCCSTWMTAFPSVSTKAVRYQQLSINPQKISGQCGRLKCCLNFELDNYTEALKAFPSKKIKLKSQKEELKFFKLDVFKGRMFYYNPKNPAELMEFNKEKVHKIIELNSKGKYPASFKEYINKDEQAGLVFEDAVGQDRINRFDKKKKK